VSDEEYCAIICSAARRMGIGMIKESNHYIWVDYHGLGAAVKTPEEEDPKIRLKLACESLVNSISIKQP